MRTFLNKVIQLLTNKSSTSNDKTRTWRDSAIKDNNSFVFNSDYDAVMKLIKNGEYNYISKVVLPEGMVKGVSLGEIAKSIMEESCKDLGIINETIRIELASIIAYGSIYSHRNEMIADNFVKKILEENNIELNFPKSLIDYMENGFRKKKYTIKNIIEIYVRFYITKAESKAELESFKKMGIERIRIETCRDEKVCNKCKKHDRYSPFNC